MNVISSPAIAFGTMCHASSCETIATAVVPIIIETTHAWEKLPFGKLQALPSGGKAIPTWKRQDEGWANVAAGIERVAEELRRRTHGELYQ